MFDLGTFDWDRASAILLSGAITGLVSGIVVVATYFLGKRQANISWERELDERKKERKRKTPRLAVVYRNEPPLARLSGRTDSGGNPLGDFFDFHIRIENRSNSQHAERVEAVLEGIWVFDSADKPIAIDDFLSIRLRYDNKDTEFVDINPQRHILWNLGYLPNPTVQAQWLSASRFVDIPGPTGTADRFYLDVADFPFHQPNRFVPGKYGVLISVYAENAKRVDQHFLIDWTGRRSSDIQQIVNDLAISPVRRIE